MKITVVTGVHEKHGNSFAMTEAFIKEAEHCGHEVKRFDAAFMKIGGCHACMTCYKTGKGLGNNYIVLTFSECQIIHNFAL